MSTWSMGFKTPFDNSSPVDAIDWAALTHVIHVGVEPQSDGSLRFTSPAFSADATNLIAAAHANGVKVCLNVWSAPGSSFQNAVTSSSFVANIMTMVNTYGYDGVDLDWEAGFDASRMAGLLAALRAQLGPRVLTADALGNQYALWGSLHQYLDRVNIMTYDFAGTWDPYMWFNAALYGPPSNTVWSVDLAVSRYLSVSGVPAEKLNIGLPFFGQKFTGGTGPRQNYGTPPSMPTEVTYRDLVTGFDLASSVRDSAAHVPWVATPGGWISYDDNMSIIEKVQYVAAHGLGGVAIWTLDKDYLSSGTVKHPLIQAVKTGLGVSMPKMLKSANLEFDNVGGGTYTVKVQLIDASNAVVATSTSDPVVVPADPAPVPVGVKPVITVS